jgi:hypothetical protein
MYVLAEYVDGAAVGPVVYVTPMPKAEDGAAVGPVVKLPEAVPFCCNLQPFLK